MPLFSLEGETLDRKHYREEPGPGEEASKDPWGQTTLKAGGRTPEGRKTKSEL